MNIEFNTKIELNFENILENSIFFIMIFEIVIGRWLFLSRPLSYLLSMLILAHFVINFYGYMRMKFSLFSMMMVILYFFINNRVCHGSSEILMSNLKIIIPSLLSLLFVSYELRNEKSFLFSKINFTGILLNIYYVINVPVLLLQLRGNTSLSGIHPEGVMNTMSEDLISGLLGYNGTPVLALFICFMFFFNLFLIKRTEDHLLKIVFHLYNFLMTLFMAWISINNDNKFVFILFVIFGIVYFIFYSNFAKEDILEKLKKIFPVTFLLLVSGFIIYGLVKHLTFLNEIVSKIFLRIQEGVMLAEKATGSAERIGGIIFALKDEEFAFWGRGLGEVTWRQPHAFGFYHFGQSDLSVFLILGGIILVALISIFLFSSFKVYEKISLESILMSIMILTLMTYTQVFTEYSFMYLTLFFVILCYLNLQEDEK